MSPEENRHEMRRRFDAVNAASEARRESRRDFDTVGRAEENRRWLRPDAKADADDVDEVGENDSLGG
jgi:hypothetical protein